MNQNQSQSTLELGADFVLNTSDPAYVRNPYPTYQWLRENAPAYPWPGHHSVVFTRYDDVKVILSDPRFTADYRQWEYAPEERHAPEHADYNVLLDNNIFRVPESDHARLRKLVSGALSPRSVERMRGEVQRAVDEVLDLAIDGDHLNVRTFAESLPLQVISDVLKIPGESRVEFGAFVQATIRASDPTLSPEALAQTIVGMPRWISMLREIIAERRKNPLPDDLTSMLIAAHDASARLSENEMLALIHALITAGSDTTLHALCFAVYTLLRHPQALAEIRADQGLLRNAVEECLRFDLFTKSGAFRFCRQALEFNGVPLRRGQMCNPFVGAALHDPEVFPEPGRFDIHRDLSQTLSFGIGSHFCLGATLARMELDLATNTLIQRFPAMKLVEEPVFEEHFLFRPMAKLLVQLR